MTTLPPDPLMPSEAPPPTPQPRVSAPDIVLLSLFTLAFTLILAFLLLWTLTRSLNHAIELAVIAAAVITFIVFMLFVFAFFSDDIGKTLIAYFQHRERMRQIAELAALRTYELELRHAATMEQLRLEQTRGQVAEEALKRRLQTPVRVLERDRAEELLMQAITEAYRVVDPRGGFIPNQIKSPFSRERFGADYQRIVEWLAKPGRRFGIPNQPWVARYHPDRRAWQLNLQAYPDVTAAMLALFGRIFNVPLDVEDGRRVALGTLEREEVA
jgi:ABC-type multidrug transport system fused ATPase/permease subunit